MSMWDDDAGYTYDDPKHSQWADYMAYRADTQRKATRENAPAPMLEQWVQERLDAARKALDEATVRVLALRDDFESGRLTPGEDDR